MDRHTIKTHAVVMLFVGAIALVAHGCMAETKSDKPAAAKAPGGKVVATVGDHVFTLSEVDQAAGKANSQLYQQLYTARRAALDQLVADYLLDQEAASRGISKQELLTQEVASKVTPVTPEEVSNFYDQNKARMGGRTLDQMNAQIQAYLEGHKRADAQQAFLDQLKAKHHVDIALEVPRVEVRIAANDPRKGPDRAPVRIIEFSDFQ
jgi:hypothetical protein